MYMFSLLSSTITFTLLQVSESLLVSTINCLIDVVRSESATLASIAMEALGHVGLRGPLPAVDRESMPGMIPV